MSGSVSRDPRGTWSFVVGVPGPDGRRQQVRRRGFPTKKAAAEALAIVVAERSRGTYVRPTKQTVAEYLEEWMASKYDVKPSTLDSYRQLIRAYVAPTIGAVPLSRLDAATLNSLYGELLRTGRRGRSGEQGSPLSPKTVRNVHGLLHRALKDAVILRKIQTNPADFAQQPRKRSTERTVWGQPDLLRFIEVARSDRCGALWHLLATTGMRRGELMGLRWSDVDLDTGCVHVRQTMTMIESTPTLGTPKSEAGTRSIWLDAETLASLRSWRRQQNEDRLLMGSGWQGSHDLIATEADGTPIHPQVLSRRFKAMLKAHGLPQIRLHDVRHSYATAALAAGVPVKVLSERLGHAEIGVTLRVYAHVLKGDDQQAAELSAAFIYGKNVTKV